MGNSRRKLEAYFIAVLALLRQYFIIYYTLSGLCYCKKDVSKILSIHMFKWLVLKHYLIYIAFNTVVIDNGRKRICEHLT